MTKSKVNVNDFKNFKSDDDEELQQKSDRKKKYAINVEMSNL